MKRRYLSQNEAASAMRRNKAVEAFLGGFDAEGTRAIRWLEIRGDGTNVTAEIWESQDVGSEVWIDVYSFGALDHDDAPAVIYPEQSFESFLEIVDSQYPGTPTRLVNEGGVQEEYLDYKRAGDANPASSRRQPTQNSALQPDGCRRRLS